MLDRRNFHIGGTWAAPSRPNDFAVLNPATEEPIAAITLGGAADIDRAVTAARHAFDSYSRTSRAERLDLLRALREVTRRREGEMAEVICQELGAPRDFCHEEQAAVGVGHLDGFIAALEAQPEREILPNGDTILREPVGVCGLITPWNWPLNQVVLKVVPALATGCCCILKPSELTPLSAMLYAEFIEEAGFPPGSFNLVNGTGEEVGAALSRHAQVDMISFTGSTRAGRAVSRDGAQTIKRVMLELGGKSPNLVFADVDLETAVRWGVRTCFANSGQSCDAPTRMLVERSVYDTALAIAGEEASAQGVGDPALPGDHIGPLISRTQWERVQEYIRSGVDEGARLLCGGPGLPEGQNRGYFTRPTVFADVTPDMRICREEIFGPVLCIQPFDSEDEAIDLANDTPYGLAGYIQTGDPARAERVAARLRVGMVYVNGQGQAWGSPFGGMKQSGNGREGGRFGLEEYQEVKSLHLPPGFT
ncbi:aldehyde dehydrogenase family protein [Alkalilacustris brevis]|uniref:aldehyde dehydrogenase family protein n=1 Tax=Alkalilacustris brevis TaxID=2026338 RepID=UPI000E0D94BD|nr:aldehyde dehydrogenase family protein [Alkalilacustris brevis]